MSETAYFQRRAVPVRYLDRQMGVIKIDGKPVAVAIAVQPASGTHESGTANLTSLARWLVANANTKGLPAAPNC